MYRNFRRTGEQQKGAGVDSEEPRLAWGAREIFGVENCLLVACGVLAGGARGRRSKQKNKTNFGRAPTVATLVLLSTRSCSADGDFCHLVGRIIPLKWWLLRMRDIMWTSEKRLV